MYYVSVCPFFCIIPVDSYIYASSTYNTHVPCSMFPSSLLSSSFQIIQHSTWWRKRKGKTPQHTHNTAIARYRIPTYGLYHICTASQYSTCTSATKTRIRIRNSPACQQFNLKKRKGRLRLLYLVTYFYYILSPISTISSQDLVEPIARLWRKHTYHIYIYICIT